MTLPSQIAPGEVAHLSEEAFDDILMGGASAADERHLAACEACSMRLNAFRRSLAIFNQASAAWSVARSNTISREIVPRRSSHPMAAALSLASVTIVAIGVSFSSHLHRSRYLAASGLGERPILQQASKGQRPLGQQEIASDNAMLAAIDSKLSEPVHSPVVAYNDEAVARESPRASSSEVREE